jgi:hypothetical protein
MAFDFPASPTSGQSVTNGSAVYRFDGTKWAVAPPTGGGGGGGIADAPNDGTGYIRKSAAWSHIAYADMPAEVQQVPVSFPFSGTITATAMVHIPMTMPVTIAAFSSANAATYVGANPAATATFTLYKVRSGTATSIGTVQISTSGVITFGGSGDSNILLGDVLRMTSPADTTLADVGITVMALRT